MQTIYTCIYVFSVGDGKEWTVRIYILKSEASVCATVRRYFPAHCDKREHTGHALRLWYSHICAEKGR